MIHRNATMTILLQEFPKALKLIVPSCVRSPRAKLEAQFSEPLHFDGVETGAFPWFAADELVVHAPLGGYPVSKFGAQRGGHIAVAVFVLVVPQLHPHLIPPYIKVPTRHALPRHAGTSSASRTARHAVPSSLKSQSQQSHGLIVAQSRGLTLQMSAENLVLARHPGGQDGIVLSGDFDVAVLGLVLDDFDVHIFPGGWEIHADLLKHFRFFLRHAHIMTLPPPHMHIPLIFRPLPQRRKLLICLLRANLNRAVLLLVLLELLEHAQPLGSDRSVSALAIAPFTFHSAEISSFSGGSLHFLHLHLGRLPRPPPLSFGGSIPVRNSCARCVGVLCQPSFFIPDDPIESQLLQSVHLLLCHTVSSTHGIFQVIPVRGTLVFDPLGQLGVLLKTRCIWGQDEVARIEVAVLRLVLCGGSEHGQPLFGGRVEVLGRRIVGQRRLAGQALDPRLAGFVGHLA
mmetsp:Transcript_31648/g.60429  ORF Transcript_31648/g.60429 Transcript_31648/m.60429 type:complete len:457 (+) Transcript_31648:481-1851(+)